MTPAEPSDPVVQIVPGSRGPIGCTVEGDGPAVVTVHGLPGSVRDFRWLGSALAGRLRLIRVDLPGFGDTPVASGPGAAPVERARVVVEVLDALGVARAVVLGHSMGGPVATALVTRWPERASGLALVSSVGLRTHHLLRNGPPLRVVSALMRVPFLRNDVKRRIRESFVAAGFPTSLSDVAIERTIRCAAATSIPDHAARVRALQLPCLVAWCGDDRLIEDAIATELAEVCPPGPRLRFDEGGHNLQKTHAVELADALVELAGAARYRAP